MRALLSVVLLLAVAPVSAGDPPAAVSIPGGPPSSEARDCGAARDHCLRGDAWFATGFDNEHGNAGVRPVFTADGKWYLWSGRLVDGGTAYRTKVATASTLRSGRQAFVFAPGKDADAGKLPRTEREALTSRRWSVVVVWEVDEAAGTFKADDVVYPIDTARIPSDPKGI